jgi:Spy/CpxP family protein refolding chaperone
MKTTLKRIGIGLGTAALAVVLAGAGYEHLSAQAPDQGGGPRAGRFGGPGGQGMGRRGGPGGPGGPGMGFLGPMMGQLNLTSDQRDRVRQIVDSHRTDQQELADREMKAHEALQAAITASFDESAIRARANDVASVDADQAVLQARIYHEVVQILTPEQQDKLKTLQTQMQQRRDKMQQRRQR